MSELKKDLLAVIAFLLITTMFFLPIVQNPSSTIMGWPSDSTLILRAFFGITYNIEQGVTTHMTKFVNAPFGADYCQMGVCLPITFLFIIPLALATNIIFAYNVAIFQGVFLGAVAMYFLARHFLSDRRACWIAGLIFGFCPFVLVRSLVNFHLVQVAWIPLFILALFRFEEKKNWFNAIALGVSLALVGFVSYYFLYFCILFLGVFYLHKLLLGKTQFFGNLKYYVVALTAFALIFLVVIFPLYQIISGASDTGFFRAALGDRTNLMNAVYLSAWPHHFVSPPVYHPLFGPMIMPFTLGGLVGGTLISTTTFVGFSVIALAAIGLLKKKSSCFVSFFAFALLCFFVLAIGTFARYVSVLGLPVVVPVVALLLYLLYVGKPRLAIGCGVLLVALCFVPLFYPLLPSVQGFAVQATGIEQLSEAGLPEIVEHLEKYQMLPIPMPSFFLFKLVPVFRGFNRLVIIIMVCLAVLAGAGAQYLFSRIKSNFLGHLLFGIIVFFVLFEFANFPPYILMDLGNVPPEYDWLAQQKEEFIVIEYPLEWEALYYPWQPVHKKPLVNGRYSSTYEKIFPEIMQLSNPRAIERLALIGTKYIVVHNESAFDRIPDNAPDKVVMVGWMSDSKSVPFTKQFEKTFKESPETYPNVELVRNFGGASVYKIVEIGEWFKT